MHVKILRRPSPLQRAYLAKQLAAYNARKISIGQTGGDDALDVLLLDNEGHVVGGIVATTRWDLLEIKVLWVQEGLRGKGHGSALLEEAEQEARRRHCRKAVVDTFSFQSPEFYTKRGYEVFGVLEDCPDAHRRYYLQKILT
jgi:GNAT superfamily N-acetyltransferase